LWETGPDGKVVVCRWWGFEEEVFDGAEDEEDGRGGLEGFRW
jgi:hypothetical protein